MITGNIYRLDNNLSENEIDILSDYGMGIYSDVQILSSFHNECFILLCADSRYYRDKDKVFSFAECYGNYPHYFNKPQYLYYYCTPKRIVKFFHYYLIESHDFPEEWYRVEQQKNGNMILYVYSDSLEDALAGL